MRYDEFVQAVATRAGVSPEQARALTHAGLETLADRISGGEANDLADQLPEGLADHLRKPPTRELAEPFRLGQFVERVMVRAGVDRMLANAGVHAVLTTLRDAVAADEFDDMMAQLPKEFRETIEPVGA
jgi:uncharacterized protein (DUF2267 family)